MVEHHSLPSPRPSLVQEVYVLSRNVKGKWQGSPSEFPPVTAVSMGDTHIDTTHQIMGKFMGRLAREGNEGKGGIEGKVMVVDEGGDG